MKRENYKVAVSDFKEGRNFRKALLAIGENVAPNSYYDYSESNNLLVFNSRKEWLCGALEPKEHRELITFKELIKLLVNSEPEKIAVKVENEQDFVALMKYYDGLGFKWRMGENAIEHTPKEPFPLYIGINEDSNIVQYVGEHQDIERLNFQDFAKQHDIKLPLIKSEDGVWLFEGDEYHAISYVTGKWNYLSTCTVENDNKKYLERAPHKAKAFSTKKSALDWIDAQKPKEIEVEYGDVKLTVTTNGVSFNKPVQFLMSNTLTKINNALKQLNNEN